MSLSQKESEIKRQQMEKQFKQQPQLMKQQNEIQKKPNNLRPKDLTSTLMEKNMINMAKTNSSPSMNQNRMGKKI